MGKVLVYLGVAVCVGYVLLTTVVFIKAMINGKEGLKELINDYRRNTRGRTCISDIGHNYVDYLPE